MDAPELLPNHHFDHTYLFGIVDWPVEVDALLRVPEIGCVGGGGGGGGGGGAGWRYMGIIFEGREAVGGG